MFSFARLSSASLSFSRSLSITSAGALSTKPEFESFLRTELTYEEILLISFWSRYRAI
jgi:hypothetical protein